MEANKQYLRYKKQFKMQCIFKVVASAVALLTLIFLIFIPCFRISLLSYEGDVGLGDLMRGYKDFSVFDEMIMSFKSFSSGSGAGGMEMISKVFSVYQILSMLFILAAIVMFAVDCVKSCMGIVNLENYSLLSYDEIKSRAGAKEKRKYFSASRFFISGVMLEIIYIIINNVVTFPTESGAATRSSYFMQMTGVSGAIAVVIIFAVAAIGLLIYSNMLKSKIKTAILKEDYNLADEQPVAEEAQNAPVYTQPQNPSVSDGAAQDPSNGEQNRL